MTRQRRGEAVGMPTRAFLFTLDQVSEMISVPMEQMKRAYIHWDRRTPGVRNYDKILARNIAPHGETPDWRIAEVELVRWLRRKGFRLYDRDWVVS